MGRTNCVCSDSWWMVRRSSLTLPLPTIVAPYTYLTPTYGSSSKDIARGRSMTTTGTPIEGRPVSELPTPPPGGSVGYEACPVGLTVLSKSTHQARAAVAEIVHGITVHLAKAHWTHVRAGWRRAGPHQRQLVVGV